MRFLLDTNVLSELVRTAPAPSVVRWVSAAPPLELAISVLTIGELAKGVALRTPGRRRDALHKWFDTELPRQFLGRLLEVDAAVATIWGRLSAEGAKRGRALPVIDGLLLATAAAHGLTLVTRNERDCAGRGVDIVNPWQLFPSS